MSKSCGRDIQERARLLLEALLNYKPSRDRESFERLLKADLESTPKPRRGYDKNQKLAFNIYELNDETGRVIEASLYSLAKLTKFTGNKELSEQQVDGVIYCLCLKEFGILEQSSGQGATIRKLILKYENIRNRFNDACERWNTDKSKFHKPSLQKSQVNSTHHHNIPANIPRSGVSFDCLFGRSHELEQLHQLLQQGNRVAISAIAGMGGVGKTELAIQYALKHLNDYPGGVCWLPAKIPDMGIEILKFARSQFALNPAKDWDLKTQLDYCWRRWQSGSVLVVLDDVTKYEEIEPYLPLVEPRFKVLMTTRLKRIGKSIKVLPLDVLNEVDALKLLESHVGEERIQREPDEAKKLCAWLEFLPLGLELVGRYLDRKPELLLDQMRQRLEEKRLNERSLQKPEADMTAKLGVRAAFEVSWETLNDEARQLGCLLSLFAPASIPWRLVGQAASEQELEDLEGIRDDVLLNLHLLQHIGEATYRLHQLVREFFQQKLQESVQANKLKQAFATAMVAVAKQIPDLSDREVIALAAPVVPHMAEAAAEVTSFIKDEDCVRPFYCLGEFYENQGFYNQAAPWYEQCLLVARTRLGDEHPDVAESLDNLGNLYYAQGRYSEAESLCLQALALKKHLLGDNHSDVVGSLNNWAELCRSQGRYGEAESLYLQALELKKHLPENDYPLEVAILNNLAGLYYHQERYGEAEPLYLQALELSKHLSGAEDLRVAKILNNLGSLYYALGRDNEAEPLLVHSLELRKGILGDEHPVVATSLNNLAIFYQSQGCHSEAEKIYIQALELKKRLLGNNHSAVATSLGNLASLYHTQGRYGEAESLCRQALKICEQQLGANHPSTVFHRRNLRNLKRDIHTSTSTARNLIKPIWEVKTGGSKKKFKNTLEEYKHLSQDN